jgi:hypothetical protein
MKLKYIVEENELGQDTSHWMASSESGNYEETGPDPLTAVTRLALLLEIAAQEDNEPRYRY